MNGAYTRVSLLGAVAPVLILGVPVFDMFLVMYIRFRRGMPIMQGSPDHFALRLRKWRLSVRQTVVASYGAAATLGVVALLMTRIGTTAAIATLCVTLFACVSIAYALKKVDMSL
jgi:UDP-GlcNAc:undecaprenyl-phosphate GlcNAc-1-phosphate transferase